MLHVKKTTRVLAVECGYGMKRVQCASNKQTNKQMSVGAVLRRWPALVPAAKRSVTTAARDLLECDRTSAVFSAVGRRRDNEDRVTHHARHSRAADTHVFALFGLYNGKRTGHFLT